MSTRLDSVVIDALHPSRLARFWAGVLGWEVTYENPDEVVVEVTDEHGNWADTGIVPLVFGCVPEAKAGPNLVHLDLASSSRQQGGDRRRPRRPRAVCAHPQ